jgi:hypothetical protein
VVANTVQITTICPSACTDRSCPHTLLLPYFRREKRIGAPARSGAVQRFRLRPPLLIKAVELRDLQGKSAVFCQEVIVTEADTTLLPVGGVRVLGSAGMDPAQ